MINKILVPVDFSENSKRAIDFARVIANTFDAELILLNTYQAYKSGFQSKAVHEKEEEKIRTEAESKMQELVDKVSSEEPTLAVKGKCLNGQLLNLINLYGKDNGIDLIVMGTQGAKGIKYTLLGSNTFDIARKSSLPLLSVPNEVQNYKINKVAFFSNYSKEDIQTINALISTFGKDITNYHIVHIHEAADKPTEQDYQKLKNWAKKLQSESGVANMTYELTFGDENIEVVKEVTERHDIDLLALTMHDPSFWDKLLNKSLSRAIILQSKTPVFLQPK